MDNKDLKAPTTCGEHANCIFRIELLEKWKESVEKKMDSLSRLLLANLTGVILTLLGIIGGLLIYVAK